MNDKSSEQVRHRHRTKGGFRFQSKADDLWPYLLELLRISNQARRGIGPEKLNQIITSARQGDIDAINHVLLYAALPAVRYCMQITYDLDAPRHWKKIRKDPRFYDLVQSSLLNLREHMTRSNRTLNPDSIILDFTNWVKFCSLKALLDLKLKDEGIGGVNAIRHFWGIQRLRHVYYHKNGYYPHPDRLALLYLAQARRKVKKANPGKVLPKGRISSITNEALRKIAIIASNRQGFAKMVAADRTASPPTPAEIMHQWERAMAVHQSADVMDGFENALDLMSYMGDAWPVRRTREGIAAERKCTPANIHFRLTHIKKRLRGGLDHCR